MTLESTVNRNRYVGNGATKTFPFTFRVWKSDQIKVFVGNGKTEQDKTASVSVVRTATGGSVSFSTPPKNGEIIVIRRNMPYIQEDDYKNGTRFDAEEIEDRFDADCAERQDLLLGLERALTLPETSDESGSQVLQDIMQAWQDILWALEQAGVVTGATRVVAAGTTTPRAIQDRFGDVANVKDFGAKGDGVTDDTSAISLAMSSAAGRIVFFPPGVYVVTSTIEVPDGTSILGSGTDVWDLRTWVTDDFHTAMDKGTTLLFEGDGAKTTKLLNLSNELPAKTIDGISVGLLPFTENDSSGAVPATPKFFSVGVKLGRNCTLKSLRVMPSYNGISGYIDYTLTGLGDEWDVGVWSQTGCNTVIEDVQTVGYWRQAGLLITENDGSFTQVGDPERVRVSRCILQGRRGAAIRNAPQIGVVSNTSDTVTIKQNSSMRIAAAGKFIAVAYGTAFHNTECTFSSATVSGGNIVLGGVSPSIGAVQLDGIRFPARGNNFSNTVFNDCVLLPLAHRSQASAVSLGVGPDAPIELDGFMCRNIVFVNCKLHGGTSNAIFGACGDIKSVATEYENGRMISWDGQVTESKTGCRNIRFVADNMASQNDLTDFTPTFFYSESMALQINQFKVLTLQNPMGGSFVINHPNGKPYATLNSSSGSVSLADSNEKLYSYYNPSFRSVGLSVAGFSVSIADDLSALGDVFHIYQSGNARFQGTVSPTADESFSLGTPNQKWGSVYAKEGHFTNLYSSDGSVSVSDERSKENISDVNEQMLEAWGRVRFKIFQRVDAIERKGAGARLHVGVIAQEVQKAFSEKGLNADRFGLFCYDEWEDKYDEIDVVDSYPVFDENGIEVEPMKMHKEKVLVQKAGNRFGIRYDEALALECAYQRWRLEQLEERVNQLTNNTND